jgi:hypothetical protein
MRAEIEAAFCNAIIAQVVLIVHADSLVRFVVGDRAKAQRRLAGTAR